MAVKGRKLEMTGASARDPFPSDGPRSFRRKQLQRYMISALRDGVTLEELYNIADEVFVQHIMEQ